MGAPGQSLAIHLMWLGALKICSSWLLLSGIIRWGNCVFSWRCWDPFLISRICRIFHTSRLWGTLIIGQWYFYNLELLDEYWMRVWLLSQIESHRRIHVGINPYCPLYNRLQNTLCRPILGYACESGTGILKNSWIPLNRCKIRPSRLSSK